MRSIQMFIEIFFYLKALKLFPPTALFFL